MGLQTSEVVCVCKISYFFSRQRKESFLTFFRSVPEKIFIKVCYKSLMRLPVQCK